MSCALENVKRVQPGCILLCLKPRFRISCQITGCAAMERDGLGHLAPRQLRNILAFLVVEDDPRHGERTTDTFKEQVLLPAQQEVHQDDGVYYGPRPLQRRP